MSAVVKGRKAAVAVVVDVDEPLSVLSPSSSASSIGTMPDTPVDEPASTRRVLALAPAFQPRAVSFPVQLLPAGNMQAAVHVAVAPVRGPGPSHARTQSTGTSNRHLRCISMPDVVGAPRSVSPSAQYNEAYEALAAKYLKTPQLNYLNGDDLDALSPPSSPESVLFIEQTPSSGGLPKNFLRRRRGNSIALIVEEPEPPKAVQEVTEDGWMTWASPPRPIPALHGPASLPYARCPSGAEGTVIEEQSSIPTVIWGLDAHTEDLGYVHSVQQYPGQYSTPSFNNHRQPGRTYGAKDRKGLRGPRQAKPRYQVAEHPTYRHVVTLDDVYNATAAANRGPPAFVDVHSAPPAQQLAVYQPDDLEEDPVFARLRREAVHRMDQQSKRQRGHTISGSKPRDLLTLLNLSPDNDTGHITDKSSLLARLGGGAMYPTPPGLSTPMFSSAFSPLTQEERDMIQRRWEMMQSPNTPASMASVPSSAGSEYSPSTHELSEQLRRLVLGPLRQNEHQSMPRQAVSLPATPLLPSLPVSNYRSPGAHVSADGRNISVWDIVNGKQQQQQQKGITKKPPTSPSTGGLSTARSIPLSRLRQNSGGLPPVPEEPEHSPRTVSSPNAKRMTPKTTRASNAMSWRKSSASKFTEPTPTALVAQSKIDIPQAGEVNEPVAPKVKINLPGGKGGNKKLKPKADKAKEDISILQLDAPTVTTAAAPVEALVTAVGVAV